MTTQVTVLLVEDDRAFREMLADAIGSLGYRVLAAESGAEALRLVDAHEGPLDWVVTDVVMPEMGGPELAERLRARLPTLRVIYISGLTERNVKQEGLVPRDAVFLHKPFALEDLFGLLPEADALPDPPAARLPC
ncbi:MAG: response regulator [Myxococcota bacterium]|nr:response regulator [Myxococcota bacterium]